MLQNSHNTIDTLTHCRLMLSLINILIQSLLHFTILFQCYSCDLDDYYRSEDLAENMFTGRVFIWVSSSICDVGAGFPVL